MGAPCKLESTGSHVVLGVLSTFDAMAGFWLLVYRPRARRQGRSLDLGIAIWISPSKVAKVLERPVEAEYEWFGVVMAHDFNNNTVFMVAAIIGGVVLLLGLVGALA